MKQQYRVSAVLASSLGQSAEVPHDIMTVLKARHCSTPFAPEIVTVLSELGYDARRAGAVPGQPGGDLDHGQYRAHAAAV